MYASKRGRVQIVALLLQYGPDLELHDNVRMNIPWSATISWRLSCGTSTKCYEMNCISGAVHRASPVNCSCALLLGYKLICAYIDCLQKGRTALTLARKPDIKTSLKLAGAKSPHHKSLSWLLGIKWVWRLCDTGVGGRRVRLVYHPNEIGESFASRVVLSCNCTLALALVWLVGGKVLCRWLLLKRCIAFLKCKLMMQKPSYTLTSSPEGVSITSCYAANKLMITW